MFLFTNTSVNDEAPIKEIYLEEIKQRIHWEVLGEPIEIQLPDSQIAVYTILDTAGRGTLEIYNLENKLLTKGEYCNALTYFSYYLYILNETTITETLTVAHYYQPIKNGIWCNYKVNGEEENCQQYKLGSVTGY